MNFRLLAISLVLTSILALPAYADDNTAPTIQAIPEACLTGSTLTFTAVASDSDYPAQSLFFSLINGPQGASIDSSTGAFSWTPSSAQNRLAYHFHVRVTDSGSPNLYAQTLVSVYICQYPATGGSLLYSCKSHTIEGWQRCLCDGPSTGCQVTLGGCRDTNTCDDRQP
jgi:hypothetical protein